MKARSIVAVMMVLAVGMVFAADVWAQTEVTVQDRSFAWTGKSGQDANYRWSATINNPSGRELNVRVTIELLDSAGAVVGQNSSDVMLTPENTTSVQEDASIAFATAETAEQYRITLMEVEE